jgi:hypothetical protein
MPSTVKRKRRPPAKLIIPFDPAFLLEPEYLYRPGTLPKSSPLRNPREHWTRAAGTLDAQMRRLDEGSARIARAMLVSAQSFREKCANFFDEASGDLTELAEMGVSPNAIAASVVLFAWDWRHERTTDARKVLRNDACWWRECWRTLNHATYYLPRLRAIARLSDFAQPPRPRRKERLEADFTNCTTDGDDGDEESEHQYWEALEDEWLGDPRLDARIARVADELPRIIEELRRTVARFRSTSGDIPDDKRDCLVSLLATIVRAYTGEERHERLARLLNAADLPGKNGKRIPFSRDAIRKRLAKLEGSRLTRDIEHAVGRAIRAAKHPAPRHR